eukprot:22286-Pyramimonas_sp.AAC.1
MQAQQVTLGDPWLDTSGVDPQLSGEASGSGGPDGTQGGHVTTTNPTETTTASTAPVTTTGATRWSLGPIPEE